jgi:hypothetical protein
LRIIEDASLPSENASYIEDSFDVDLDAIEELNQLNDNDKEILSSRC